MTARGKFSNPIEGVALGDPFVLRHRGRFYLYGTNDGPPLPDGRVIPVFRSDDLLHWTPLGGALVPAEPQSDHWAPEVLAWNGRFHMVVSFGDVDRRGHALWVAVADRPEGPFRLSTRVNDPSERFSIDGSWLLDDDGRLYLFRCLDFVAEGDLPSGTGIVVQEFRDPLTPLGPPVTVLRAHSPWQVFEKDRLMPLYGGRRFAEWNTVEGPAPVRRGGRYYCGYSGGNYAGAYGTGEAVADAPMGPYRDLRGRDGPIFGTTPGLVEGPGHFSVVRPDLVRDWIVLHGRVPGEAVRRVWLCPASWGPEGVTIGGLTTRPQPSPALPDVVCRLSEGVGPDWQLSGDAWSADPDGLRHGAEGPGLAWRPEAELSGDWVAEVYVAFPEEGSGVGGLTFRSGDSELLVLIDPGQGGRALVSGRPPAPLPTLGSEPFYARGFHAVEVRATGGRAEVRVDGVVVASGLDGPPGAARVGLTADGAVIFDALTLARIS